MFSKKRSIFNYVFQSFWVIFQISHLNWSFHSWKFSQSSFWELLQQFELLLGLHHPHLEEHLQSPISPIPSENKNKRNVTVAKTHVWVMNAKDYHQISPLIIYRYYDNNCSEYILTFKIELDS